MQITLIFNQCFWAIKVHKLTNWLYIRELKRLAIVIHLLSRWITNIDIYPSATLGADIKIIHGFGIVIGDKVRIGNRVTILQQVTVGAAHIKTHYTENDIPTIENDVVLGAGSKILGGIVVGSHSIVGANAVVINDVPSDSIAVGVPARVFKKASYCLKHD